MKAVESLVWQLQHAGNNRQRRALQQQLARAIAESPINVEAQSALPELIPHPTPIWRIRPPEWAMEPRR